MNSRGMRADKKARGMHVNVGSLEAVDGSLRGVSDSSEKKEISVLMLLLASESVPGGGRGKEREMLSTEHLALEMGVMNMNDTPLVSSGLSRNPSDLEGSASSAGETDSVTDRAINFSLGDEEDTNAVARTLLQEEILLHVLSFLPWRSVLRVRGVNKIFLRLSLPFVTVCRLPRGATPALFIPCHEDLLTNEETLEAELASGFGSLVPPCRTLEELRTSSARSCSQYTYSAGRRMFIGQLRRDGTVPMLKWLLSTVLEIPNEAIMSVENHRNKTSNRGKGCAWVALHENAVSTLLDYHHRIFFDNVWGVEGVWLVPPRHRLSLAAVATVRGSLADRPKHMPRNTLVVEMALSVPSPNSLPPRPASQVAPPSVASPVDTVQTPPPPPPSYERALCWSPSSQRKPRGPWRHNPYSLYMAISPLFPL